MADVSKRLATDETLRAVVDALNNRESVQQAKAEIQAEGATQVANVTAAAEEITGKVAQIDANTQGICELRSDFIYQVGTTSHSYNFNWNDNGYVKGDGTIVANSNNKYTDIINITLPDGTIPTSLIVTKPTTGDWVNYCFYNSSSEFVYWSNVQGVLEEEINIPSTATKLRISASKTVFSNVEVKTPKVVALKNRVSSLEDAVNYHVGGIEYNYSLNWNSNGFVNQAGNIVTNVNNHYTNFIDLVSDTILIISKPTTTDWVNFAFYDIDENFVSYVSIEGDLQKEIAIPTNATKCRFSASNTTYERITFVSKYKAIKDRVSSLEHVVTGTYNVLFGKKIIVCGDSITEANNPNGGHFTNYAQVVAERNNMNCVVDGFSGSTMTNININSFSNTRYLEHTDYDYLTIWFGFNDGARATLGTINDTEDTTFYGAYKKVLSHYITNYPTKKLGVVVPYMSNADYQIAVREVSALYGVPCLDLPNGNVCSCIWGTANDVQLARRSALTYDGTHPNQVGHNYIATMFEHFLRSL